MKIWQIGVLLGCSLGCSSHINDPLDGAGEVGVDARSDVRTPIPTDAGRDVWFDAATDVNPWDVGSDASIARDVVVDVGVTTSPIRCTRDSECSVGWWCAVNYPGGLCMRTCSRDEHCGDGRICEQGVCLPGCTPDTVETDCPGGAFDCERSDPGRVSRNVCVPACQVDPPETVVSCLPDYPCEPSTGCCGCVSNPWTGPSEIGGPCESDDDCLTGRCIPDDDGVWFEGMCFATGTQVDASEYIPGGPLPQSDCPVGSVLIPNEVLLGEPSVAGTTGLCFKSCTESSECRDGYECELFAELDGIPFSIGVCFPLNCGAERYDEVPNRGCPCVTRCEIADGTDGGIASGYCVRY
jgi:hypothetical protein